MMTYEQSIDRCDALEFLMLVGGFPDFILEGGPSENVSPPIFKTWRFIRTMANRIVFSNGLVEPITCEEFEDVLNTDL